MSIQSDVFNTVLKKRQKRSTFDLSHDVKLSLDMGNLVPIYVQECVPGDSIKIQSHSMVRFAPLIAPVMHRMQVKMEYFFVPNRIIWNDWETFITGSRNGKALPPEELPVFPTFNLWDSSSSMKNAIQSGELADYLGLPTWDSFPPTSEPDPLQVSLLPFAAYQRIYDEYYRDQNMVESVYDTQPAVWTDYNSLKSVVYSANSILAETLLALRKRAWQHDYFTSALPFAQKGEAVEIPLSTEDLRITGEITFDSLNPTKRTLIHPQAGSSSGAGADETIRVGSNYDLNTPDMPYANDNVGGPNRFVSIDNSSQLLVDKLRVDNVDGTSTFPTTINDLRTAIRLQEWLETNARGGTRYIESVYAHFGVKSSDKRLQRPEFIGSSRANVMVSEVFQTSSPQTENDTPQGNMSGTAGTTNSSRTFKYFAEEHGYIIGLMTVIPDTAYFQGVPKHFMKTEDRLQYYFPEFAHLGEQEIDRRELWALAPKATFGYIPRYSEYRYITSRVSGDFRNTLKYWHLSRDFGVAPNLNADFITSDPSKRIFAVEALPESDSGADPLREFHTLYAHVFHSVKASRLMPKYGTPLL